MSQYDLMLYLKIKLCHCDLYFMVLWFCLISWRQFDVYTWYFGLTSQYDLMLDLKIKFFIVTYISWFSGLYLENYFMYKAVTLVGGIREPLLTCSSLDLCCLQILISFICVWGMFMKLMADSADLDLVLTLLQGCHSQGKISGKWNFFPVREKSGNFVDSQGNLERTWKVREFENKWL